MGTTSEGTTSERAGAVSGRTTPDLTLRDLTAGDRDRVRRLHEQMSEHDAYMRFFGPLPRRLDDLAAMLCLQDATHAAVGAFAGDGLVGVANYVATGTDAAGLLGAEFALVVVRDLQEHGVGTMLIRRLANIAYESGVRHMTAEILAENTLMLSVFRDLGWSRALRHDGTVVHLDLELSPAVLSHPGADGSRPSARS